MSDSSPMASEKPTSKHPSPHNPSKRHVLPTYVHEGRLVTKGIQPEGESGRSGVHPYHLCRILWRSSTKINTWLNLLWPFTIVAIALYFSKPEEERSLSYNLAIFATSFIGIVPAASTLDFAGAEFARKIPRVIGIVVETLFGGIVEIVLFMILIAKHDPANHHNNVIVIQAAILGSILANILLCLGACFLVGGLKHTEQKFHKVISEVGSGVLLMAAFALVIVPVFYQALIGYATPEGQVGSYPQAELERAVVHISRGAAIVLFIGFFVYLAYNIWSHDSIFDEVLVHDEERDQDREEDLAKSKLTMTETIIMILVSLTFVSFMAYFLVAEIEPMIEHGVHENFLGLILIPVVEKAAEHLSAVDEAYDNQINFALFHCLAPSIQTALFNAPLVIFVGWGLGIDDMDLNFEIVFAVMLILAIIVVGNVLRDGSSDYLEGALLIFVYIIIAIAAYSYPNATQLTTNGQQVGEAEPSEVTEHAIQVAKRLIEAGYFPREL